MKISERFHSIPVNTENTLRELNTLNSTVCSRPRTAMSCAKQLLLQEIRQSIKTSKFICLLAQESQAKKTI